MTSWQWQSYYNCNFYHCLIWINTLGSSNITNDDSIAIPFSQTLLTENRTRPKIGLVHSNIKGFHFIVLHRWNQKIAATIFTHCLQLLTAYWHLSTFSRLGLEISIEKCEQNPSSQYISLYRAPLPGTENDSFRQKYIALLVKLTWNNCCFPWKYTMRITREALYKSGYGSRRNAGQCVDTKFISSTFSTA